MAIARPIPDEAPVTTTQRPSKSKGPGANAGAKALLFWLLAT
jgi:hypothetical protein